MRSGEKGVGNFPKSGVKANVLTIKTHYGGNGFKRIFSQGWTDCRSQSGILRLRKPEQPRHNLTTYMMNNLTVAEYFAGIGLMRLGLELGGWSTVFANDIDANKREMYEHHFGRSPAVLPDDIHLLNVTDVPQTMLATASFPCNDLSLAGARKGLAGQHSSAFWGFIRHPHLEALPGDEKERYGCSFRGRG